MDPNPVVHTIVQQELKAIIRSQSQLERHIRFQVILELLHQHPHYLQQQPKFHALLSRHLRASRPSQLFQDFQSLVLPGYNLRMK